MGLLIVFDERPGLKNVQFSRSPPIKHPGEGALILFSEKIRGQGRRNKCKKNKGRTEPDTVNYTAVTEQRNDESVVREH